MNEESYLGTGMKFPIQINPATGRIEASSGLQSVKESIYIILTTARNERLARPYFGANLDQYTFMDVNYMTLNMLIRDLTQIILTQEPRVESVEINPEPDLDNGRLILNIDYYVAGDYSMDSIVYPFYLNIDTGEDVVEIDEYSQLEDVLDDITE